eukprot:5603158-Pleurochrysis_carterae.AAC.1
MSTARGMPTTGVSHVTAERALEGLATAVGAAERARDSVPTKEISTQPTLVDFHTLDLSGWKRWGALSLFRDRDGVVRFTDGRAVASRRSSDGGVDIAVYASVPGRSTNMAAE